MADIRVLGVHGIGDHHTDTTWQGRWNTAITEGVTRWNQGISPTVSFFMYDEVFAAYPLTFIGSVEALAKLLGSGIGSIFRRQRGLLDDVQNQLRWYAGMVVQWVENEKLRKSLRDGLVKEVKAFGPSVICGHSLGSLVCYDAFTHPDTETDLKGVTFVSFGSQIANPFVAGNFLAGRITALNTGQWYHLFNRNDKVFTAPIRLSAANFKQVQTPFDVEGWADHEAVKYLSHSATSSQVWSEIAAPKAAKVFLAKSQKALSKPKAASAAPVRRALIVGVSEYNNPEFRLEGCVNDAFLVSSVLQECGFVADDIRLLLDKRATASEIRSRLDWLLNDAAPGDELVFYFSGHGTQLATYGLGDVVDQFDEALVPTDFDWTKERSITDDQIWHLYSQLPYDVTFVMILDCCHAGGLSRGAAHRVRGLNPPDDIRHRSLRWDVDHQMWVERSLDPLNDKLTTSKTAQGTFTGELGATRRLGRAIGFRGLPSEKYDAKRKQRGHKGPYLPVIMQACRESEFAYEYEHGSISHGAFTFALAKNLRAQGAISAPPSFKALVRGTAKELKALGYDQVPGILGPSSILAAPVPWMRDEASPKKKPKKKATRSPRGK